MYKNKNKELLAGIAAERIQTKLMNMFCGKGVADILHSFADVIAVLLPSLRRFSGLNSTILTMAIPV